MHQFLQPQCPDCQAMLAEHERACQNCGSTAIVDLGMHDLARDARGSWQLPVFIAAGAVALLLIDRCTGSNLAAATWEFLATRN
jgi:predicted amidophosphoribosyltransferase